MNDHQDLCLKCGFCCNGVIFADIKLRSEELAGLLPDPASEARRCKPMLKVSKLRQPCPFFEDSRCQVYSQRPAYCRQFECVLLQELKTGRLRKTAALQIIRTAQQRANTVKSLLQQLGETDESAPLRLRFKRATRLVETIGGDKQAAAIYADLTLAMHDLNHLLSDSFYPG